VKKRPAIAMLTQANKDVDIEPNRRPLSLNLYKRMLRYTRPYRGIFIALTLVVIVRAAQLPLLALAFSAVINGPIKNNHLTQLLWGVGGYAALAIITQYTLYHRLHLALLVGEGVVHDLRFDIFSHLQRLTSGFFSKTKLGRLISRITSDAETVRAGIQDSIFASMVAGGQIVVALLIMAFSDHWLFLVVLATAPAYYVTYQYFRQKLSIVHRANQESFSRLTSTLAESISGIRVTQVFARQDSNAKMWNALVSDHAGYNLATIRTSGQFSPLLELINALLTAALFIIGGWRIFHHSPGASLEALIAFFFLLSNVLEPVGILGTMYTTAVSAMAGAERIFSLLDRKPDFADPPDALTPQLKGRVEFRNLGFGYDPAKPILCDITFTALPGQTIALVGHTGSGKTSIINLISKFYLPDSGRLLVDDIDIRQINSTCLHRQMGIVLQVNYLFTGTVMENIRLGMDRTDQQVIQAARDLDILDLLMALPQGLETTVGERGAGLSLGQRQLVCFARAMLADPRIMILDEATSSVDSLTEMRIQRALNILLKGRTSFVVAHRLSTIRQADQILVLDHGRIIERGRHTDLLATSSVYSGLYQQFVLANES
jgi:ATP-binding cassette subfamily B protein